MVDNRLWKYCTDHWLFSSCLYLYLKRIANWWRVKAKNTEIYIKGIYDDLHAMTCILNHVFTMILCVFSCFFSV